MCHNKHREILGVLGTFSGKNRIKKGASRKKVKIQEKMGKADKKYFLKMEKNRLIKRKNGIIIEIWLRKRPAAGKITF